MSDAGAVELQSARATSPPWPPRLGIGRSSIDAGTVIVVHGRPNSSRAFARSGYERAPGRARIGRPMVVGYQSGPPPWR